MSVPPGLHGDELVVVRHLEAASERVWTAFTTAAGIAAFWGGSHAVVPPGSVAVDLRVGGSFTLDTRGPGGATRRLTFTYTRVVAPRELGFDESTTGIRTTVTLRPAGEGTDLTVHQRRLPPELRTAQAADGLDAVVDALAAHLRDSPAVRAAGTRDPDRSVR